MWTRSSVSLVLRTRRVLSDLLPTQSPLGRERQEQLEAKGQGNSDITDAEISSLAAWYGATDATDAEVTGADVLRRDFARIQRRQNGGAPQVGAEG